MAQDGYFQERLNSANPSRRSESDRLPHQNYRQAAWRDRSVDDQDVVESATGNSIRLACPLTFQHQAVFMQTLQTFVDVRHDLLRTNDPEDLAGATRVGADLAATHRSEEQAAVLGHRVCTSDHVVRSREKPANFVRLGLAVHRGCACAYVVVGATVKRGRNAAFVEGD